MFKKDHSKKNKILVGTLVSAVITGSMFFAYNPHVSFELAAISPSKDQASMVSIQALVNEDIAYELIVDDKFVGTFDSKAKTADLVDKAKSKIIEAIGYEPDFDYSIAVKPHVIDPVDLSDESAVIDALEVALYEGIGEIMVKACILKIDDFTVALENQGALKEVLESAQNLYVQDDSAIRVSLQKDRHNSMVLTPHISLLSRSLPKERVFVTSKMTGEPMEDLKASDDQFLEAVVTEVNLDQEIIAVETYVPEDEIIGVTEATEMITKEHEKKKMYTIKAGDVPSTIAKKNDMATSELYDLNPGLRENDRRMQIGDELVVMTPEPELHVRTVENVIYTEIIDRDIIYVNDPDAYIGTFSVMEQGADGVIEIRATVEKLNGNIVSEEITEQTRILEPVTETQYRGVKALPVTTATGTFEMPMLSYRFTSAYGYRWGRLHKGIDLAAPTGTAIKASDGGRVIQAGWDGGYGYSIEINHGGGLTTKYGHCSALYVGVGDQVSQYQTIAAVGNTGNSTGPHLHFEIRVWNTPKDPMKYIKQ